MGILETLGENLTTIIIVIITSIIISVILYFILRRIKNKSRRKELLFKDFNAGNFKVVMYRKIGERYQEIDKVRIDIKNNKFTYGNKDFTTFNMSQIAFSDKKNNYYAFDYETGEQLSFKTKGMPDKITIDDVDIYVNRHIIQQIVAGLEEFKPKSQWTLLILGLALGVAIGIILGIYVFPQASQPVQTPETTPTPLAIIINIFQGVLS